MTKIPPLPPVPELHSSEMQDVLDCMVSSRKEREALPLHAAQTGGSTLDARRKEQALRRQIVDKRREERGWPTRQR